MARGDTRPNKKLESPFKHPHQYQPMVMRSNNSSVLEELYQFTINSVDKEKLWVSSKDPFVISLKLGAIQEAVREEKLLDADCFNLAVRNMQAEDTENLQNTNFLGWRHYVYQDWAKYAICGDESRVAEFTTSWFSKSTAYDAFGSHLVLIPVLHAGHWTLYAFSMWDRKVNILDSLPGAAERHKKIRLQICSALNQTMGRAFNESDDDFCRWEFQFPPVPMQQNSYDSGFFVLNFMRLWDGYKLIQSFSTISRELREDLLAYILSRKGNWVPTLPLCVASWINHLSERKNMARKCRQHEESYRMNSRLQKAVMEGNVTAFEGLLNSEAARLSSNTNSSVGVDMDANEAAAPDATTNDAEPTCLAALTEAIIINIPCVRQATINNVHVNENQTGGAVADANSPAQTTGGADQISWLHGVIMPPIVRSVLLRGVTSTGDGVLHIAARHGHENLVHAIFRRVGVHQNEHDAAAAREQHPVPGPYPSSAGINNLHSREEDLAHGGGATAAAEEAADGLGSEARQQHRSPITASGSRVASFCHLKDAEQGERGGERDEALPDSKEEETTPATACNVDAELGTLRFADFLRARNHMGETCLHEAVRWGNKPLVDLLIAVDAGLNDATSPALVQILDDDGASPLYLATTLRRVEIIKALTYRGYKYSVSHAGPAGKTALHAAVLLTTKLCELLLTWNKSLAKSRDELGRTPLHYMGTSDTAITELILNHDASSGYCTDLDGWLPIHFAASRGRLDIIRKLLEKCPDCRSSCNASGQTFFHVTVQKGHKRIVHYVCTRSQFSTILNMRDQNGDTALHVAVQNGSWGIFLHLLRNKEVCLSFINKQGCTPLDIAVLSMKKDLRFKQRNREWIFNDLLAAGADFCSCRWDHFSSKSSDASEHDNEKEESEKLSKSAGLFAAGALLIMTISFQAPFDAADKSLQAVTDRGNGTASAVPREKTFASLAEGDAVSLTTAVVAIFFCTFAGFPTSSIRARFLALVAGGASLFASSLAIIVVFVLGLSMVYPRMWALVVVYVLFAVVTLFTIFAAIKMSPPTQIIAHGWARYSRLGMLKWMRSLFRKSPGSSMVPLLQVMLFLLNLVGLFIATYFLVTLLVKDVKRHSEDIHCINGACRSS